MDNNLPVLRAQQRAMVVDGVALRAPARVERPQHGNEAPMPGVLRRGLTRRLSGPRSR